MKAGDIIKAKYNGHKQKFQILGVNDVITDGCLNLAVLDYAPYCYEETINVFAEQWKPSYSLNKMGFSPTFCREETVNDDHSHRVYLKPIPW